MHHTLEELLWAKSHCWFLLQNMQKMIQYEVFSKISGNQFLYWDIYILKTDFLRITQVASWPTYMFTYYFRGSMQGKIKWPTLCQNNIQQTLLHNWLLDFQNASQIKSDVERVMGNPKAYWTVSQQNNKFKKEKKIESETNVFNLYSRGS